MKADLFFVNLTQNQVYSFVSMQNDYDMSANEAFNILTVLVKNKLVIENDGAFCVVADEKKLNEFKEAIDMTPELKELFGRVDNSLDAEESEENKAQDDNDSKFDDIWDSFFKNNGDDEDEDDNDDEDEDDDDDPVTIRKPRWGEDFGDDDDEDYYFDVEEGKTKSIECPIDDLKKLEKEGYFLPMPEDVTLYVDLQAYDDTDKKMKIDIRHSIKQFLENLEIQEPELLKAFFVTDFDYKLYIADKRHLHVAYSYFVYGDNLVKLYDIDFKKPIIKQRYLYSLIASNRLHGESYYVFVKLFCKRN